jgi:hypothetical protein
VQCQLAAGRRWDYRHHLDRLTTRNGWWVEFGAWDGKHLSNTRRLIDEENYSAVLIEANSTTFQQLEAAFAFEARVHCLRAFVGFGKRDNLDATLATTPGPEDFDVLSIDIDGRQFRPIVRSW